MTKQIEFEGQIHEFPDDATEDEINEIINKGSPAIQQSPEEQMQGLQQQHPYLMKMAEALQNHPALNKAINQAAPYAEHFNRATQGTGLPNLSKGLFVTGDKFARALMNSTPTGVGLPAVDIPSPGWDEKQIPEVNPRIQQGAEIAGKTIPYAAALTEAMPALRQVGTALADTPGLRGAGTRALNRVQEGLEQRGMGAMEVPEEHYANLIRDGFLRNTAANRRLIERARQGDYRDLFNLQSDLGGRARNLQRDPFSAANRDFGRDIEDTRQELLTHMRRLIDEAGHGDLAQLMRHGQNRYRQHMAIRPWRNSLLAAAAASAIPFYKDIKKLIP